LSVERRRTEVVREIIQELFANGRSQVRPGDVNSVLRERGMPMGTWEVRAEFTALEAEGAIILDPATAGWLPSKSGSQAAKRAGG
jgi:hypothetical protein